MHQAACTSAIIPQSIAQWWLSAKITYVKTCNDSCKKTRALQSCHAQPFDEIAAAYCQNNLLRSTYHEGRVLVKCLMKLISQNTGIPLR